MCALALRPSSNHQPPLPNSSISFSLSLARSATLERSPPSSLRLLSPSWDDVSPLLRRSILLSLGARHGSSERQPSAIRIKPREAPRRGERERVENHRRCSRRRNFSNPVSDRDTPPPPPTFLSDPHATLPATTTGNNVIEDASFLPFFVEIGGEREGGEFGKSVVSVRCAFRFARDARRRVSRNGGA